MRLEVDVEGEKLRMLLIQAGLKQGDLADKVGVSKFTVSRWCKSGLIKMKEHHARTVADILGVTPDDLCKPSGVGLTSGESDWLAVYRRLSPLEQARARVYIEEWVISSKTTHRGASSDN